MSSYRRHTRPAASTAITSPSPGRLGDAGVRGFPIRSSVAVRAAPGAARPASRRRKQWCRPRRRVCACPDDLRRGPHPCAASVGRQESSADHAACAPSTRAAARPRPSAMPPAAITGSGETASTTAGMSGSDAVVPSTWPPASQPWATTTSTPALAARRPPRPSHRRGDEWRAVDHRCRTARGRPTPSRRPGPQARAQRRAFPRRKREHQVDAERSLESARVVCDERSSVVQVTPRSRRAAEAAGI